MVLTVAATLHQPAMKADKFYALLGVRTPFDPTCSLVTSPFLPPLALAACRLALALYGTVFVVVKLVYEGVNFHTDSS